MFHDKAKRAQQGNLQVLIAIFSSSKHRSLPLTLLSQVATLSAGDTKDCQKLCRWEGGIDCSDKEHHSRRQKFSASALAIPVSALVALMGAINCHFHLATKHQRCSSILPPSTREWKKQMFSISAGNDNLNKVPIFAPQHKTKMVHAVETREHRESLQSKPKSVIV